MKKLHPDTNNSSKKNSHGEFVRLNEAYSILSNPSSRRDYDSSNFKIVCEIFMTKINKLFLKVFTLHTITRILLMCTRITTIISLEPNILAIQIRLMITSIIKSKSINLF